MQTAGRRWDDAAFEALYDRYHRNLLAFCHHMLGSREEAEDVLQHTFLAAYRSLRAGEKIDRLKPWLYTVARNRCLSVLRERHPDAALDDGAAATDGLVAEVERRADLRALVRDVHRLPPDQRAALVLFELGDQSQDEIAESLGVRREKVKALVFQAREALMAWRAARETPCEEVREQLATLTGSALRRRSIRRHVEQCPGCAGYEAEVRGQRAALAIVLPVVPAAGLKATVLGSVLGGSGVAAAGGGGLAAKLLVGVAIAGGVGGTGYVAVDELRPHREPTAGRASEVAASARDASRAVPARPVALPARPERAGTERRQGRAKDRPKRRGADDRPARANGPESARPDEGGPPGRAKDRAKGPANDRAKQPGSSRRGKKARPDRAKTPGQSRRGKKPRPKARGRSRRGGKVRPDRANEPRRTRTRGEPRRAKRPVSPKPDAPKRADPKPKPKPTPTPTPTPPPAEPEAPKKPHDPPPGKSGK
jgi:RNA polymerase sigma factor (sigma-70 family)